MNVTLNTVSKDCCPDKMFIILHSVYFQAFGTLPVQDTWCLIYITFEMCRKVTIKLFVQFFSSLKISRYITIQTKNILDIPSAFYKKNTCK
jgi:hypothetical protein